MEIGQVPIWKLLCRPCSQASCTTTHRSFIERSFMQPAPGRRPCRARAKKGLRLALHMHVTCSQSKGTVLYGSTEDGFLFRSEYDCTRVRAIESLWDKQRASHMAA